MSTEQQAKEAVIAAALQVAAGRQSRDVREPGPWDDAHAEMEMDILDEALYNWASTVHLIHRP